MKVKAMLFSEVEVREMSPQKIAMLGRLHVRLHEAYVELDTGGLFDSYPVPKAAKLLPAALEETLQQFGRTLLDCVQVDQAALIGWALNPSLDISGTEGLEIIQDGIEQIKERLNAYREKVQ